MNAYLKIPRLLLKAIQSDVKAFDTLIADNSSERSARIAIVDCIIACPTPKPELVKAVIKPEHDVAYEEAAHLRMRLALATKLLRECETDVNKSGRYVHIDSLAGRIGVFLTGGAI